MKIEEADFIAEASATEYAIKNFETTLADLKKKPAQVLQPMCDFIEAGINSDKISSAELFLPKSDITIKLQMSIINLPLEYAKNINKIMVGDGVVPVDVYMIIASPFINKSKMRIDELALSDEFVKNLPDMVTQFVDWTKLQLDQIEVHEAEAADEKSEDTAD
ncbi:hypothetical protein [Fructilactobacillus sanfranciscensis]|uniref:hypothetical protein n=1 Tax=Fructilactobacillus sanfranciscensis TaxID=1625 RepID=UPI0037571011